MLENAPIGFAFFDPDLRYVRLNEQFAEICALPSSEILGKSIAAVCAGPVREEVEPRLIRVFDAGGPVPNIELKTDVLTAEGVHRSWLMHFYPVRMRLDTIRWAGVIAVEITDRLQAEEALRKTEKLAAAGRLAASIAHEINNPLEAVTNLLYILGTHEHMDSVAKRFVNDAQAELARVSEITQQTLRFYRQSTHPTRTNVAEVLDSVIALYHSRIVAAHVTVLRKFRGAPEVFGFSGELRQLFANLIGNALDAMPNGGRLFLSVRHGNGRSADGRWSRGVRVSVSDTGIGMSAETRRRIFEAFFTTKEVTGTGLGLWVSDEIIRKHKATVNVKSRHLGSTGTSFMLFFPDAALSSEALQRKSSLADSSAGARH
jgi:PAS domain S-box-containing protein